MAQFPSRADRRSSSYDYRTLGLGYANLGALLMCRASPTTRDEGRAICGALTAIMTGDAYATSAEMAERARAVPRLRARTASAMLRVIRNHRRAAYSAPPTSTRA